MPPQITPIHELRFDINRKQTLLVREFIPKTNSDFTTSSSGGTRKDQGIFGSSSSAGICEGAFYTGVTRIKGAAPGANIYIKNSMDQPAVIVQLEDT